MSGSQLEVRVQGATSDDGDVAVRFDPRELFAGDLPMLRRPQFVAIVASVELARGLAADRPPRRAMAVPDAAPATAARVSHVQWRRCPHQVPNGASPGRRVTPTPLSPWTTRRQRPPD